MEEDLRLHAPAALRNRDLIADILQTHLPPRGLLLEIASGSGQHCIRFAERLPHHVIQPSDPSPQARASIDAWVASSGVTNVKPALNIDASLPDWPIGPADAVACINMIHISPWRATTGLFTGAAQVLTPGGLLYTYGPYMRGGEHTSEGNAIFDADLRRENPEWGLRSIESVSELAAACGFTAPLIVQMPANNLSLIFKRAV
jgi:cyclopropane fatty-acyl-phospholipid synthase-like methyltransferase